MTNPYYNGGSFPSTGSPATSASMRAELASISTGFDKLPTLSGNGGKLIAVNSGATALEATTSLSVLSVVDAGFTVVDNVDATKKIAFEVSSVTTGTTRTITAPDVDLTLVGTATTQTLTNKTVNLSNNTLTGTLAQFNTALSDGDFATLAGTETLTNKTLTSPRVGTSILDTNGNELFLLTATTSAVNELTYANAATGGLPSFTASGSDANISINLVPKGTGTLRANNVDVVTVSGTQTLTNKTIGVGQLSGQVSVASGGTGTNTLNLNNVILGNGTSAVQFVAPGTSGNLLTSNGSTWTSAAPAVTLAGNNGFTGANTFGNATGQTFLASATVAQDGVAITGRVGGTGTFRVTLAPTTLTASRAITLPDVAGTMLVSGATTISVPASAMVSRTSNGAASGTAETTTNKVMIRTLDFDAATAEYAQFSARMPKNWDEGTVTAFFLWSNATGTGNVVWGIQGLARSDGDALDTAFGTAATVTDGVVTAAGNLMQSAVTGAITIGGTPAENDLVIFQVYREAANVNDTLAADARLHNVVIVYTTNAANDA